MDLKLKRIFNFTSRISTSFVSMKNHFYFAFRGILLVRPNLNLIKTIEIGRKTDVLFSYVSKKNSSLA